MVWCAQSGTVNAAATSSTSPRTSAGVTSFEAAKKLASERTRALLKSNPEIVTSIFNLLLTGCVYAEGSLSLTENSFFIGTIFYKEVRPTANLLSIKNRHMVVDIVLNIEISKNPIEATIVTVLLLQNFLSKYPHGTIYISDRISLDRLYAQYPATTFVKRPHTETHLVMTPK